MADQPDRIDSKGGTAKTRSAADVPAEAPAAKRADGAPGALRSALAVAVGGVGGFLWVVLAQVLVLFLIFAFFWLLSHGVGVLRADIAAKLDRVIDAGFDSGVFATACNVLLICVTFAAAAQVGLLVWGIAPRAPVIHILIAGAVLLVLLWNATAVITSVLPSGVRAAILAAQAGHEAAWPDWVLYIGLIPAMLVGAYKD